LLGSFHSSIVDYVESTF
jgi:NADH:ubiquinone reductase (non-electrogenic)